MPFKKRPIDPNPGRRLAELRLHRGLSLAAIAGVIGVYKTSIREWEHGRTAITADRLLALASALDCAPADILAPAGSPVPPRPKNFKAPTKLR